MTRHNQVGLWAVASRAAVVIALAVLSACSTTPTKTSSVLPIDLVKYYDISGSTLAELRRELDAKGPKDGGRGVDAYTRWYFRWEWPGYGKLECDLSAAVVHAEVEVTFPRWQEDPSAPLELRERWQRYIDALAQHENGHVELAVRHRETVLQAIQSSTCENADESARRAVQSLNAANAAYDRKTQHGRKDGAKFP